MSGIDLPPAGRPLTPAPAAQKSVLSDLPVVSAPDSVPGPSGKTVLDARVAGYDSNTQILKLRTGEGEIAVKSPFPLKPGMDIRLEVSRNADGRTNATLTPQRNIPPDLEPQQQTPKPVPPKVPQPPLKPGDTSTAIFITDRPQAANPPASSQSSAPSALPGAARGAVAMTAAEIATVIEQIKMKGVTSLPQMPKDTLDILTQFLSGSATPQDFQQLPEESQQKLFALFQQIQSQPLASPAMAEDNSHLSALLFGSVPTPTSTAAPASNPQVKLPADAVATILQNLLPLLQGDDNAATPVLTVRQGVEQLQAQLPQDMFRLDIADIIPQGKPLPTELPLGMTQGVVEKITTQGAPVIRTPDGFFVLDVKRPLPVGTTVIFKTEAVTAEQWLATIPAAAKSLISGGFMWPALQESIETLSIAAPEIAGLVRNTVPSASGGKFAATALFFMAALKSGAIGSWLGENTLNVLRQAGRKGLLEKLSDDFSNLSKQSQVTTGEWRGISMPFLHEDNLSMLQFFVKHSPLPVQEDQVPQSAPEGQKHMTRFILNFSLARMGDVQLDGLVQREKMDMILRTADALPLSIRQDIMQAYARGIEQTHMQGGIGFQTRQQKWIDVPQNPVSGTVSA